MILKIEKISKSYLSPSGGLLTILEDINLTLTSGQSLAIVGPSGSGKSTLLNIIGGLDSADSGSITLAGTDISKAGGRELAEIRNKKIGFIFQQHHLLPQCTAIENVLIPTLADSSSHPDALVRAQELLSQVGLADRMHHRPGQLSLGQCQRVAIARALINSPVLVLADEPTGSLDAQNRSAIMEILLDLQSRQNVALLVATHSKEVSAMMGGTLALQNGKLIGEQAG